MDAMIQSCINSLRTWRMRREANGKPAAAPDLERRAKDMWPSLAPAQITEIVVGAMK